MCSQVCVAGLYTKSRVGRLVHSYSDGLVVGLYIQSRVRGCFIDTDTGKLLVCRLLRVRDWFITTARVRGWFTRSQGHVPGLYIQ